MLRADDLKDQGRKLTLITPSDTVDVADVPKALLIGNTGGTISIDDVAGGTTATVIPVSAGQVFDAVRIKRLRLTNTTATPVYGIF